jgi:hypothetical protein
VARALGDVCAEAVRGATHDAERMFDSGPEDAARAFGKSAEFAVLTSNLCHRLVSARPIPSNTGCTGGEGGITKEGLLYVAAEALATAVRFASVLDFREVQKFCANLTTGGRYA